MGLRNNKGAVGFSAGRGVACSQRSPSREPILLLSAALAGSDPLQRMLGSQMYPGLTAASWPPTCTALTHRAASRAVGTWRVGLAGEAMLRPTPVDTQQESSTQPGRGSARMARTSPSFWGAHSTPMRAPRGQGQGVPGGSWALGGGSSGAAVGFVPVAKLHCSLEPPGPQHRVPEGLGCRWSTPGCPPFPAPAHRIPAPWHPAQPSRRPGTQSSPRGCGNREQRGRQFPRSYGPGSAGTGLRAPRPPPAHHRFQTMVKLRRIPVPGPAPRVPQALPTRRSPRAVSPGEGRSGARSGAPGAPTCRPAQTKRGRAPARPGAMRRAGAGTGGGGPGTPPPPSRRPRPPLCAGAPGPVQVAGGGGAARGAQRGARSRWRRRARCTGRLRAQRAPGGGDKGAAAAGALTSRWGCPRRSRPGRRRAAPGGAPRSRRQPWRGRDAAGGPEGPAACPPPRHCRSGRAEGRAAGRLRPPPRPVLAPRTAAPPPPRPPPRPPPPPPLLPRGDPRGTPTGTRRGAELLERGAELDPRSCSALPAPNPGCAHSGHPEFRGCALGPALPRDPRDLNFPQPGHPRPRSFHLRRPHTAVFAWCPRCALAALGPAFVRSPMG